MLELPQKADHEGHGNYSFRLHIRPRLPYFRILLLSSLTLPFVGNSDPRPALREVNTGVVEITGERLVLPMCEIPWPEEVEQPEVDKWRH